MARRSFGAALFIFGLLLAAPPESRAESLEAQVRAAALRNYIHGMTAEIAEREVGNEGAPVLLDLLADPDFPRRDNVVAFLAYLGGPRSADALLRFLADPPSPVEIPEEDRALLLAPQALGHIAARGHKGARQALLAMTADRSEGGVLASAASRSSRPERLRDDLLEMALRGLAYCKDTKARRRLHEIARGKNLPAPGGRKLDRAAKSAMELLETLQGAPGAGLPPEGESAADPGTSGGTIASVRSQVADTAMESHQHRLDCANHVDHNDPMTDPRLDQVFAEAVSLVHFDDFAGDVACCVTFRRKNTAQTFGSPGDGLDVIDDLDEQIAVQIVTAARVKVVRIINFCGAPGMNFIGCSGVSPEGMTVVRMGNLTAEAILWTHEYGHNVGLSHNPGSQYIMYGTNTGMNNGVNAAECDKFHNPHPYAQADVSLDGACVEPVCGNATCDLGENCGNCPGDCISGTGFTCGNGICDAADGEDCLSCDLDCNGKQTGNPAGRFCCGDGDGENPAPCSDPLCSTMGYQCIDVPNVPHCCGDFVCEGLETAANCAVDCVIPMESLEYYGLAEGGSVDFTISGVSLQVVTTPGQTAIQIAALVAAEINNNAVLSASGITAMAAGNVVTTNGIVDSHTINDPGLSQGMPEIPALSAAGGLLALLLLAAALLRSRRLRRQRYGPE